MADPRPAAGSGQMLRISRFVVAGALNTGLTYLLYLLLLQLMPYVWAYSITYAAGIVGGYLVNARWVFRQKPTLRSAAAYPVSYAINYALGLCLLWLAVEKLGVPKELAPLLVVVITTPVMYMMSKTIFREEKKQ
jgi:putative flippase GtrA